MEESDIHDRSGNEEEESIRSEEDSYNSQSDSNYSSEPISQPSTDNSSYERVPPIESGVQSIPIPSQNILPR